MNTAELKVRAFVDWTLENGIKSPKAELLYIGPDAGYGFFSKQQIRANEIVIEVPRHMMLSSGLIAEMPYYNEILRAHYKCLTPAEVLCLFFYLEPLRADSFWRPYLDMLPSTFGTPLVMMPDMPLKHLPARTRSIFEAQVAEVRDLEAKLAPIISSLPGGVPFDRVHYIWAWHIVNTRCIYCENPCHELVNTMTPKGVDLDSLTVIPLMDMMNHDNDPQCQPGFDKWAGIYRVRVDKFVSEGNQLCVSYGSHENAKLWIDYGFTMRGNILNKIDLPISLIMHLIDSIGLKPNERVLQILRDDDSFSCHLYGSINRVPNGLFRACKLLTMEFEQLKNASSLFNLSNPDDPENRRARDLAIKLILKLLEIIKKRRDAAPNELKWLWIEQVNIIEDIVNAE